MRSHVTQVFNFDAALFHHFPATACSRVSPTSTNPASTVWTRYDGGYAGRGGSNHRDGWQHNAGGDLRVVTLTAMAAQHRHSVLLGYISCPQ